LKPDANQLFSRPALSRQVMKKISSLFTLLVSVCPVLAQDPAVSITKIGSAEINPPSITAPAETTVPNGPIVKGASPAFYSIGNPTDEEQLYVELINRARRDPSGEGVRLATSTDPKIVLSYEAFGVNLNVFAESMTRTNPVPPLSISASLTAAARLHSQDMFDQVFQDHVSSDGRTLVERVEQQNFVNWKNLGENVYINAFSVLHGHASFEVDWGFGPNGMQDPAGHRATIHFDKLREVGVGVVNGMKEKPDKSNEAGPQVVSQDFGTLQTDKPFLTGVAYHDLIPNHFYDLGEGLAGVTVTVGNSAGVTTNSGGYSVQLPGNGNFTATFSIGNNVLKRTDFTVTQGRNVKLDFESAYSSPQISGPSEFPEGNSGQYTVSALTGNTGYEILVSNPLPHNKVEGAELEITNFVAQEVIGYDVRQSAVKFAGSFAFRLASPSGSSPSLSYLPVLHLSNSAQVTFMARLGAATTDQIISLQISTNGFSWEKIWEKRGTGGNGDSSFAKIVVPLAAFANSTAQFKFVFDTDGFFIPATNPGIGFYFDSLAFTGARILTDTRILTILETGFSLSSPVGEYLLQPRARNFSRTYPKGIPKLIRVTTAGAAPRIQTVSRVGVSQMEFTVNHTGIDKENLELHASTELLTGWGPQSATFETMVAGQSSRVRVPVTAQPRYFRIRFVP